MIRAGLDPGLNAELQLNLRETIDIYDCIRAN